MAKERKHITIESYLVRLAEKKNLNLSGVITELVRKHMINYIDVNELTTKQDLKEAYKVLQEEANKVPGYLEELHKKMSEIQKKFIIEFEEVID